MCPVKEFLLNLILEDGFVCIYTRPGVKYGTKCVSKERQLFLHVREQVNTVLERNMDSVGLRRWG